LSSRDRTDMTTTGVVRIDGSSSMRRRNSQPSITGITRSSRLKVGFVVFLRSRSSASCPLLAVRVRNLRPPKYGTGFHECLGHLPRSEPVDARTSGVQRGGCRDERAFALLPEEPRPASSRSPTLGSRASLPSVAGTIFGQNPSFSRCARIRRPSAATSSGLSRYSKAPSSNASNLPQCLSLSLMRKTGMPAVR
jgi:hypothetical protein